MPDTQVQKGAVERITYHNEETGYTIARLTAEKLPQQVITIVGEFATLSVGETLEVSGSWIDHPQYGRQFSVDSYKSVVPSSLDGIRRFLGSGLIKGIGPKTAESIVNQFGSDTLDVIERTPGRLSEIEGLGPKRIASIRASWKEHTSIKELMIFLATHRISTTFATRIYKQYGDEAIPTIKSNPYTLADDIWGIGFRTADAFAQSMGVEADSSERISAAISYLLFEATSEGHTYLPVDKLSKMVTDTLEISNTLVAPVLDESQRAGKVVLIDDRVTLPVYERAEKEVAHQLLLRALVTPLDRKVAVHTADVDGLELSVQQRSAVDMALQAQVMVITGGPGTGKTTATRGIIEASKLESLKVVLCAPTGMAAKRLSDATGLAASTIHRLLGFSGSGGFERWAGDPVDADVVVVDEVSMVDINLMARLLLALRETTRLILVGDVDQLPSVGPGNVLRDIIDSQAVPVVRLDRIFRQDAVSNIVSTAHMMNSGEMPQITNRSSDEFFFLEIEEPQEVARTIADLVCTRLPEKYGLDPLEIQVLAPMYRGQTGVTALNELLQNRLNPTGQTTTNRGVEYRVGDRIIVTRNNYDKAVFNGDMGKISAIDDEERTVVIEGAGFLENGSVTYGFDELDELSLAYAITVHRSQGSEFEAVVMPVTTQHFIMLRRNLLYTGLTRAKRLAVFVGTKKALAIAVKKEEVAKRYTWLKQRLQEGS